MKNYDKINIKLLSFLSYLGPFGIIGLFSYEKGQEDVKFHYKQGLTLFFVTFFTITIIFSLQFFLKEFTREFSLIFSFIYTIIFILYALLSVRGMYFSLKSYQIHLPFIKNLNRLIFKDRQVL